MKGFKKALLTSAAVFLGMAMTVSGAQAAMLNGEFSMFIGWTPTGGTGPSDLSDATGVNFFTNNFSALPGSGDFAGIGASNPGNIQDFTFAPLGGSIPNFWTIGAFTFQLDNVVVTQQTVRNLDISGKGVLSGGGFDPTPAVWNFSGQNSPGSGPNSILSGSASTSTVPEPGTMLLMGSGLVGLGFWRKFKK